MSEPTFTTKPVHYRTGESPCCKRAREAHRTAVVAWLRERCTWPMGGQCEPGDVTHACELCHAAMDLESG